MVTAYHRRRGWAAWKTAALSRFDFDGGHPTLEDTMGLTRLPVAPQSPERAAAHLRMWRAALTPSAA